MVPFTQSVRTGVLRVCVASLVAPVATNFPLRADRMMSGGVRLRLSLRQLVMAAVGSFTPAGCIMILVNVTAPWGLVTGVFFLSKLDNYHSYSNC